MCGDYLYHDLRKPTKHHATLARCRRRREWRGVVIPEAEWCERTQLCGTDRRAIGDEMY